MFIYGRSGMTVSGRTLTNKFAATLGLTICLLGIGVAPISAQSPFTWNNATGGVFNTVGNWNPNAPSPGFLSGVDETLNLGSFLNAVTPGYSATAAAGFTRVINFNNTYGSPAITITTGVLSFNSAAGLPAQLNQNGFGLANIGGFTMASPLTVGGTGAGNLFVTGGITNNAGATGSLLSLNQTGGGFSNTGATVVLSTAGTWQAAATASTVINGANVAVGSGSSLGASSLNSITFNSGSFRFNSTARTRANNFTLNNTMTVLHSTGTSGTNTISGVIGGNGGLNINPLTGLTLALTGTNTFSGDVVYRGTNNSTGS